MGLRITCLTVGLCCLGLGCQRAPEIDSYTVLKHSELQAERGGSLAETAAPAVPPQAAATPQQMLGAILPQGQQLWFFKLMGKPELVEKEVESFQAFLQSVRLATPEKPEWTLPAGWRVSERQHPLRFATLLVGEPGIELTVSALPAGQGTQEEALLANFNRWRGQLALSPIGSGELAAQTKTVKTQAGDAVMIDIVGEGSAGGPPMMAAPLAAPPAAPSSKIDYQTPEGWKAGRVGGMRKAAFQIESEAAGNAEMTLIDLPREAGGDRLANLNRWRNQVSLEPIEAAGLDAAITPIEIGSIAGQLVQLDGTAEGKPTSILGVMFDRGDETWFAKLQGPTPLVQQERTRFEAFVKSLRFGDQ